MLDKIKVGGIDYAVSIEDLSDFNNGETFRMGQCHEVKAVIEISEGMSVQRQNQTLIHEMMHAVFIESGIDAENEEELVNSIALVLYQVLKDNDFSWIRS